MSDLGISSIVTLLILAATRWISLSAYSDERDSAAGALGYLYSPLFCGAVGFAMARDSANHFALAAAFAFTGAVGVWLGKRKWQSMTDAQKRDFRDTSRPDGKQY